MMNNTDNMAENDRSCRRCGTCCRKGGPALHLADRPLIESRTISLADLFTIRKGEPAYDNVAGVMRPAGQDIIKIKSVNRVGPCRFYQRDGHRCAIYNDRPQECRVLKCWDTREIEAIYDQKRLSRRDLLEDMPGISELVEMHQHECDYEKVRGLVAAEDQSGLRHLVRYDHHIRQLTLEKTSLDDPLLPFLFGLPLQETIGRLTSRLAVLR